MKTWIVRHADGALTQHCTRGNSLAAEGIEAGVQRAATPRQGTPWERWDWAAGEWIEDAELVEDRLLRQIDDARVRRGSAAMTTGQTTTLAYTRKGAEARDYVAYSVDALANLSPDAREARWPWLTTLAEMTATTLAGAAASVLDGMIASEQAIMRIDSGAVAAKAAVRAATGATAKRAAAATYLSEGV